MEYLYSLRVSSRVIYPPLSKVPKESARCSRLHFQAKSYLFAGGAGVLYHKALTEYIKANFVNSSVKRKYILAEGKYGKETNGAIFAVAVGGLTLAESAFED